MKLISMKNKPKKTLRKTKSVLAAVPEENEPVYPWGLEVSLEDKSIEKLKIDVENISAGDEVYFLAKAQVTRVSFHENIDYKSGKKSGNNDLGLQITEMAWGKPGKDF